MPQNNLFIPLLVAVVSLVGLTVVEGYFSDRLNTSSVTAAEFAKRFEQVPKNVAGWESVDKKVTDEVRDTAGAVGHVSRKYVDPNSGREVDLWLIVGHSRDIVRHTPDICFPSAGFTPTGTKTKHQIAPKQGEPGMFYTAKFHKEDAMGRYQVRVFWAWNGNKEGQDKWDAPDDPRYYYGNNTALYKLYFTTSVTADEEEINDSSAVEFAKLMLPKVNAALFPKGASANPVRDAIEPGKEPADGVVEESTATP
ncbi:exosortase-associated EpsI family protein [Adhaeretor mobilis]|uniref:Methanolan biosynthesis EpsI domain-containing protein n=1 Tax=Adhaeretor mobilis TaxID=1930276 RepID=A0A517N2Q6_9BACT|nr:exosortase-associated EpsI family protein [Adhaeretor mobilis]QDT01415.1 hypothetical protein HG15A2_47570 [Adhaeretor mobilis]